MKLSIKVLGYEIATADLDFGDDDIDPTARQLTPMERGVKRLSNAWVKRMNA